MVSENLSWLGPKCSFHNVTVQWSDLSTSPSVKSESVWLFITAWSQHSIAAPHDQMFLLILVCTLQSADIYHAFIMVGKPCISAMQRLRQVTCVTFARWVLRRVPITLASTCVAKYAQYRCQQDCHKSLLHVFHLHFINYSYHLSHTAIFPDKPSVCAIFVTSHYW